MELWKAVATEVHMPSEEQSPCGWEGRECGKQVSRHRRKGL